MKLKSHEYVTLNNNSGIGMKPGDRKYDRHIPGFHLACDKNGRLSFRVFYKDAFGRRRQVSLSPGFFDAKRARQLATGVEPTLDNSELQDKPTVMALREIAARKIDQNLIDEVEKIERERAEREALEWAAAEVVDDDLSKVGDD